MNYLSDDGSLQCNGFRFSLKADGPLGRAGDSILAPVDSAILPVIFRTGAWQPEEIEFFRHRIGAHDRYTMLDIGANIGLFSRQMINAFPQVENLYCFEPAPSNFEALRFNLCERAYPRIQLINAALGSSDGRMTFYQDPNNMGNYSLNKGAMWNVKQFREITVDVFSIKRWMEETLKEGSSIIWKSDTQGYDELLITQVPWPIWRRISFAVVEVWRIEKPELDWSEFEAKLADFPNHSLGVRNNVKPVAVIDYLRARDGGFTDLYMWR